MTNAARVVDPVHWIVNPERIPDDTTPCKAPIG